MKTACVLALCVLILAPAALADWDTDELYKWVQMPDLDSTGIGVTATEDFILADDFLCTEPDSITAIHVWGSWRYDYLPQNSPDAVDFIICICADVPDSLSPSGYSIPGDVLWTKTFASGDFTSRVWQSGLTEGFFNLPDEYKFPGDTVCYQYNFPIPKTEYFYQTGTPADPVVYWLSIQAVPRDINAAFGWKTSLDHWNDDAVWGQGEQPHPGPWYELRYPAGHPMEDQSIDLAFVIVGETYGIDWGDAPDTLGAPYYPTLAANNGARHIIRGPCLGRTPTELPDAEPDGQPHPEAMGDDLGGYDDEDAFTTTVLVAGDYYMVQFGVHPMVPMPHTQIWVDYNADGVWQHPDEYVVSCWGGGNHIFFGIPVPTDAAVGYTFARARTSTAGSLLPYGPAEDGEVEDIMVEILPEDTPEFKWLQTPYSRTEGVHMMATQPYILADDFVCIEPGRITEITIWGGWKDDVLPFGTSADSVKFILSFHGNLPDSLVPCWGDMPGNVLWTRTFIPDEFSCRVDTIVDGDWWVVPPGLDGAITDTVVWEYKFPIPADEAFYQTGTEEDPVRYWLDVQAWPYDPDTHFGWKVTRGIWANEAAWGSGIEPYTGPWSPLYYPFSHPDSHLQIELSFRLRSGPASGVPAERPLPEEFGLRQNIPNPFPESTVIRYALQERGHVSIEVFDVQGRLVATLVEEVKPAGQHSVRWNGHDNTGNKAPSGVYWYRMKSNSRVATRKMLLIR